MNHAVAFGRYRFDPGAARLWCGRREIGLTPKAAAVLAALIERAGEPVTRRELFTAVWGDTIVGDAALSTCVRELRVALDDDARRPRVIETRHRRGYRFVARLQTSPAREILPVRPSGPGALLVGRERELAVLHARLESARAAHRQLVFVTGEPGLGKTSLVETFLARASGGEVRIAYGRCVEQYGAGEPYLPLMEAITQLGRGPDGPHVVRLLRKHAPSWLAQLPSLVGLAEARALRRDLAGVTTARMLRELTEALEAMAGDALLVVWLEDLHWADVSTLDWLAHIGRRSETVRLLVLGSYRPAEVLGRGHPLEAVKTELHLHGQCVEVSLSLLDESAVAAYVARRFPSASPLDPLGTTLHRRTSGHPLFVVHACDELVRTGTLVDRGAQWALAGPLIEIAVPGTLDRMIGLQLDRLPALDRQVLEAASAAGLEFSSRTAAAAAELAVDAVEACCAGLAQRELFVTARGVEACSDGSVAGCFAFRHALCREAVYARVPAGRLAMMHRRIAGRLETVAGPASSEDAAELAMHHELGHDAARAIHHRYRAGEIAMQRGATREAVGHLARALELLAAQPDRAARAEEEIAIQVALGGQLMALKGRGAPEVEQAYRRAQALCRQAGPTPRLFPALWGLFLFHRSRGEIDEAFGLGRQLLTLAELADDPALLLEAHHSLWATQFARGELPAVCDHTARGLELYDLDRHAHLTSLYGNHDPGVCAHGHRAWALGLLGEDAAASRSAADAIALAGTVGHRFSEAHALLYAARLLQLHGDWRTTRAHAERAHALAREGGFTQLQAWADVMRGWATVQSGDGEPGLGLLRQGIAALEAAGSRDFVTYFLGLLADSLLRIGQPEAALQTVTEALEVQTHGGERFYDAELQRLRGEALRGSAPALAAECFRAALATARLQHMKGLERRILASLAPHGPPSG